MPQSLSALLLIISLVLSPAAIAQAPDKVVNVMVRKVQAKDITDRLEALGTLKANESTAITTTVTEKITAIHFDDGKRVEANETLVEMTSDEEHALLKEARATLSEAKKQYNRIQPLVKSKAASKSLLDQRERDVKTAKARLLAIESRMSDRLIKAPFAGVVGLRNISLGALIEPGDVITTIYDDSVMKLDFSVPATFLPVLKPGLPIEAKARAFGDQEFTGVVKSIDSAVDPIARSIVVRASLPNDNGELKPGILMSVELFKNPRRAVTIPEEALIMEGTRHYVYVVDAESKAQKKPVKIGTRYHGEVEVLSGLDEGESLIVRGILHVRPDQEVSTQAEES